MSTKRVLCVLFAIATLFLASCQKDIEVEPQPSEPVDMSREDIIINSELQYPVENDEFYYEVYGDRANDGIGYVAITKYLGDKTLVKENGVYTTPKNVIIPDTLDGLPVYVIGSEAFKAASMETVLISKNIISIENEAFWGCHNLKEVKFADVAVNVEGCEEGNGVKTIAASAFEMCSKLATIELPETVVSIGSSAFSECASLEKATLPAALEELGSSVFLECISLKEISFPEYITEIPSNICFGCEKLEDVYICDTVTKIEASAFKSIHNRAKIHGSPYSQAAHYAAANFMLFSIQEKPVDSEDAETDSNSDAADDQAGQTITLGDLEAEGYVYSGFLNVNNDYTFCYVYQEKEYDIKVNVPEDVQTDISDLDHFADDYDEKLSAIRKPLVITKITPHDE